MGADAAVIREDHGKYFVSRSEMSTLNSMIVPVLDIMTGQVVRGIAGRRHEYRPLAPSSEPLAVARSFRERFGLTTLYLADLDAISGAAPATSLYQELIADGFRLWVDAGLVRAADAEPLLRSGVSRIIAGLETLAGPEELGKVVRTCSPAAVVFSLDLKAGAALVAGQWNSSNPESIAAQAIDSGVTSLLILDLTRVGMGDGTGTDELCRTCRQSWPTLELIAGGGVRGPDDLRRLAAIGVDHVLVASALHDGRLSPAETRSPATAGAGAREQPGC